MKFWLSRAGDITVQDQIITQVILGITSHDLNEGERLPSTRGLARRLNIHPNTVSAAYRLLERRGWLEMRPGSGVYVRRTTVSSAASGESLGSLVVAFVDECTRRGFGRDEIRFAMQNALTPEKKERVIVVDPDPGLRELLIAEISEALNTPVEESSPEELIERGVLSDAILAIIPGRGTGLEESTPPGCECQYLQTSSVPSSMAGEKRPEPSTLVVVASVWEGFASRAQTILIAAGVDSDSVVLVNASKKGWTRHVPSEAFVIADSVAARSLEHINNLRVFRLIADVSLESLKGRVSQHTD